MSNDCSELDKWTTESALKFLVESAIQGLESRQENGERVFTGGVDVARAGDEVRRCLIEAGMIDGQRLMRMMQESSDYEGEQEP